MNSALPLLWLVGDISELVHGLSGAAFAWLVPTAALVFCGARTLLRRKHAVATSELSLLRSTSLPSFRAALPVFQHELERVRRFDRSLSVAVVALENEPSVEAARRSWAKASTP